MNKNFIKIVALAIGSTILSIASQTLMDSAVENVKEELSGKIPLLQSPSAKKEDADEN